MRKKIWIVVRQDTLEALQADGTWGDRRTGLTYWNKDVALDQAADQERLIGRMVGVQRSPFVD